MGNSINISGYLGRKVRYIEPPAGSCDADAQAFITAAGITNATEIAAICQLVVDLKASGVWSSLNAIYPFVGGTSTTHRYNLKNTTTYQIRWFGGVTHNSNGVTFNGVNGYAETYYNESLIEDFGNTSRAVYDRTATSDYGAQLGAQGAGGGYQRNMLSDNYIGTYYFDCYDALDNYGRLIGSTTDSRAFWLMSRTSLAAGGFKAYKNLTNFATTVYANAGTQPDVTTWIGGLNYSNVLYIPTDHNLAFASMGKGLNPTQAADYYTAVQTFQTTLGRQV